MAFDDIKGRFVERTEWADVVLDGTLAARQADLEDRLAAARQDAGASIKGSGAVELARELEELREQAEEATQRFTFRSVGTKRWRDLETEHPPSKEQQDQARKDGLVLRWDPEGFPFAAMAEASVEPKLTADDARWLYDKLAISQWERLWGACCKANVGDDRVGKSAAASAVIRAYDARRQPTLEPESPGTDGSAGNGEASPPTTTTSKDDSLKR